MAVLVEAFEDIYARFIAPLPDEEKASQERVMVTLQDAYWYYADFFVDTGRCPRLDFGQFVERFLHHTPTLLKEKVTVKTLLSHFHKYLRDIPVCGAVLLSPDYEKVLLVQGFESGSWGFPKGKVDNGESEVDCAIRETHEEIGFDISHLIDSNRWIETSGKGGRRVRLYIILGVDPETTHFQTRTRKEIADIKWWPLKNLPKMARSMSGAVRALRDWIRQHTGVIARPGVSVTAVRTPPSSPPKERRKAATPAATTDQKRQGGKEYRDNRTSRDWDAKLIETFGEDALALVANASREKGRRKGSPVSGWSAEEMFRVNEERFGVKSTVPPSDIEYPENADEIIAKYLGPGRSRSAGKRQHRPSRQRQGRSSASSPASSTSSSSPCETPLPIPPPLEGRRAVSAPSYYNIASANSNAGAAAPNCYTAEELTRMLQAAIGVLPSNVAAANATPTDQANQSTGLVNGATAPTAAAAPAPANQQKPASPACSRRKRRGGHGKTPSSPSLAAPSAQQLPQQQQPPRLLQPLKRSASVPVQQEQQKPQQRVPAVVRTGTVPSLEDFRFDTSSILRSLEAALAAS